MSNRPLTSTEAFLVCMSMLGVSVAAGIVVVLLFGLAGCAGTQPSCADNPRNMRCMSADQLEKELGDGRS